MFATGYRDDPRGGDVRAAVVQEGFDTLCTAPLLDGTELLGLLNVYHDPPHAWTDDELETMAALADPGVGRDQERPELREDGDLGRPARSRSSSSARASTRLTSVREIGQAIATEPRQLIDYHNVRVYRVHGDDLIPVALQGQVGEYVTRRRSSSQLKFGEGITGWVAEHGWPRTWRTPRRTRGRRRSRAPRTTSTSRCSSRRCSTRTRSSA